MTKVILNSGGMDSFFVVRENPDALQVFVDIGQEYVDKERASARRIAAGVGQPLIEMKGAQIGRNVKEGGIIPLRNAELILCAGQHGNDILLGILQNEVNSDKSPEFLRAMEQVMDISCRAQYWSAGTTFRIHTPLGTRSKAELLRGIKDDAEAWAAASQTVSCYDGRERHCGACPSCFKRWVAMTVASGVDRGDADFDSHPASWLPLAYWRGKGYAALRIQEIEEAYGIASRD